MEKRNVSTGIEYGFIVDNSMSVNDMRSSIIAVILTLEAPRSAGQVRHNESLLLKSFEIGFHYIITFTKKIRTKMAVHGGGGEAES